MANLDAPIGFRLIKTGGHEPIRRKRAAIADRGASGQIAAGDAYFIYTDGNARRCTGAQPPNGICEGIDLKGVDEGPMSYTFLPGDVSGYIIGIEDSTAEFEVQTNAVISQADLDAGAQVNVVDSTPMNETLGQSRQEVGDVGGNQLKVVQHVDRPNNDATAVDAKVIVKLLEDSVQ